MVVLSVHRLQINKIIIIGGGEINTERLCNSRHGKDDVRRI